MVHMGLVLVVCGGAAGGAAGGAGGGVGVDDTRCRMSWQASGFVGRFQKDKALSCWPTSLTNNSTPCAVDIVPAK